MRWPLLPDLSRRRPELAELMDDEHCDPELLRRTYAQFAVVNAVVSRWHRVYRRFLRPALSRTEPRTLLDIGSGGGDLPRAVARWAARDGFALAVTAIDPDPRAHAFATARPARPGLVFRRAWTADLVAQGARFDLVTSNHVLHHLDAAQLDGLLRDSATLCRRVAVHGDIRRSTAAYAAFGLGTWPFFHRSFIRADGLTSIRRSFTRAELEALAPAGWHVEGAFPAVNLLVRRAPGPGGP